MGYSDEMLGMLIRYDMGVLKGYQIQRLLYLMKKFIREQEYLEKSSKPSLNSSSKKDCYDINDCSKYVLCRGCPIMLNRYKKRSLS